MEVRYSPPAGMRGRGGPWGTWVPENRLHANRDFLGHYSVCMALYGMTSEMDQK